MSSSSDERSSGAIPASLDTQTVLNAAMDRYAKGENIAFPTLYELLAPRMNALLLARGYSQALTEDLLQQTFLRIHRGRGRYVPGRDVTPWVFAITRRLAVDDWRRRRKESPGSPDLRTATSHADPERQAIVTETATRLQQEIARLPIAQRRAVELVRLDGLTLAQAARVLGTTTTGVKLRLHRASVALRDALSGDKSPLS